MESRDAERSEFNRRRSCRFNLKEYLTIEDVLFVHKALIYAVECHSAQYRKSGEPYIIHPIQVAGILAKLAGCCNSSLWILA